MFLLCSYFFLSSFDQDRGVSTVGTGIIGVLSSCVDPGGLVAGVLGIFFFTFLPISGSPA